MMVHTTKATANGLPAALGRVALRAAGPISPVVNFLARDRWPRTPSTRSTGSTNDAGLPARSVRYATVFSERGRMCSRTRLRLPTATAG